MEPSERASGLAVAVVVVVTLASGPVTGGFLQPSADATTLGEGDGTVAEVEISADDLRISPGRFGTGVSYLRIPDATVDLSAVSARPRLVYRVQVPALDADVTTTKIVTDRGSYRLHHRDYGLDPNAVSADSYEGRITVRVQSFTSDRTVYERNVTVEVDD